METELKRLRRATAALLFMAVSWWLIAIVLAYNGGALARELAEARSDIAQKNYCPRVIHCPQ